MQESEQEVEFWLQIVLKISPLKNIIFFEDEFIFSKSIEHYIYFRYNFIFKYASSFLKSGSSGDLLKKRRRGMIEKRGACFRKKINQDKLTVTSQHTRAPDFFYVYTPLMCCTFSLIDRFSFLTEASWWENHSFHCQCEVDRKMSCKKNKEIRNVFHVGETGVGWDRVWVGRLAKAALEAAVTLRRKFVSAFGILSSLSNTFTSQLRRLELEKMQS